MKKRYLLVGAFLLLSGCAFIAGKEEADLSSIPGLRLEFVETLADQESLLGQSLRTIPPDLATAVTATTPQLMRPGQVWADQFRVYVTDTYLRPPDISSARIFVFDRGSRTVSVLNVPASASSLQEGKLLSPAGIAVDAAGIIFVSDSQQGRVFAYDRNGTLATVLGRPQPTLSRSGLGDLSSPAGMALDNVKNRLYVADTHAHQVKVFDTIGMHLFDIGRTGDKEDFKFPVAVALDRAGNLYVLDSLRLRVSLFTSEGAFIRSFSIQNAETPGAVIKPKALAVDSDGHIYVAESVTNTILIFSPEGKLLLSWGRTGRSIGDFWTPTGIFIDDRDYIYIADQTNGRVQTFQYVK